MTAGTSSPFTTPWKVIVMKEGNQLQEEANQVQRKCNQLQEGANQLEKEGNLTRDRRHRYVRF